MLHLVSTLARIISYAAWLGITCYPYFRTVGFLRKWIRWPVGFNMFLFKEQNTYLTFTEFEAISPLYWWANIFTSFTNPPYFNLSYFHSFKELQYKYNKKFWNFQTFFNFFEIFLWIAHHINITKISEILQKIIIIFVFFAQRQDSNLCLTDGYPSRANCPLFYSAKHNNSSQYRESIRSVIMFLCL